MVSDQGPASLAPNDTFGSLLGQVKQALAAWDSVSTSGLRVVFGGLEVQNQPSNTPGGDVVFADLPPGLLGLGAPIAERDHHCSQHRDPGQQHQPGRRPELLRKVFHHRGSRSGTCPGVAAYLDFERDVAGHHSQHLAGASTGFRRYRRAQPALRQAQLAGRLWLHLGPRDYTNGSPAVLARWLRSIPRDRR